MSTGKKAQIVPVARCGYLAQFFFTIRSARQCGVYCDSAPSIGVHRVCTAATPNNNHTKITRNASVYSKWIVDLEQDNVHVILYRVHSPVVVMCFPPRHSYLILFRLGHTNVSGSANVRCDGRGSPCNPLATVNSVPGLLERPYIWSLTLVLLF